MNHKLKMKLRELSHKSKLFSHIYHMASNRKVAKQQQLSDEEFLKRKFKENTGKELNLDNPKTFSEKLQWLKLYDRKPIYTQMADKYATREYIAERAGSEYLVPLYGVWDSFDEIDFNVLPEQFVLKCNHDCGSVVICKDKERLDKDAAKSRFTYALQHNYYLVGREWPYKDIKPRIIAEKFLGDNDGRGLVDYKLMCFNEKVLCAFTGTNRATGKLNVTFFDLNWDRMPFERNYAQDPSIISQPQNWNQMIEIAEHLAIGTTFMRVDLFEVDNCIYVGELTFFPGGGMEEFRPEEWNTTLGSWLDLPTTMNRNNG